MSQTQFDRVYGIARSACLRYHPLQRIRHTTFRRLCLRAGGTVSGKKGVNIKYCRHLVLGGGGKHLEETHMLDHQEVPTRKRLNGFKEGPKCMDEMTEEEARAERKRRQRQAQEEFRLKQMMKQSTGPEAQDLSKNSASLDRLLMEIPTQEIEDGGGDPAKRKSPSPGGAPKRRGSAGGDNTPDIVQTH